MQISITTNFPEVKAALLWQAKQARFAIAGALNEVAFKARLETQEEMGRVFDRPSTYTTKSVYVNKKATRDDLSIEVMPTYFGGKGVDPQNFIRPQTFGGARKLKRSEVALSKAGILPAGMFTAMPREPMTEHLDAFGNYKGGFLRSLLSYFQALGEQGYKGNMGAKRKAKMEGKGRNEAGHKTIKGVVYFVSYGRMRSGSLGGHSALRPGIWAKTGTHGSNVRPVLMFIKSPTYRARLDLGKVGEAAAQKHFMPAFERRFAAALATAKP